MTTDDLIRSLAADVPPVPPHAVGRRLAVGIGAGGLVTLAAIALLLGFRPDFRSAVHGFSFWMKAAYTLSMAIAAGVIVARLARPGRPLGRTPWLLAVPVLLLAIVGAIEMAHAPTLALAGDVVGGDVAHLPVARTVAVNPDLRRPALVVPPLGSDPVAACRRRVGTVRGRVGRGNLWPPLPGSVGDLRAHLVHAGHGSGRGGRRGSRPTADALIGRATSHKGRDDPHLDIPDGWCSRQERTPVQVRVSV